MGSTCWLPHRALTTLLDIQVCCDSREKIVFLLTVDFLGKACGGVPIRVINAMLRERTERATVASEQLHSDNFESDATFFQSCE